MSALVIIVAAHSLVIVLLCAFLLRMPSLTRADLFFAVTVDPAFRGTAEARHIARRYRLSVAAHAALALSLMVAATAISPTFAATGLLWLFAGSIGSFVAGRRRALPYQAVPSSTREASLRRAPTRLPFEPLLQAGPFFILAIAAEWLVSRWERIPARVPLHWSAIHGAVNRWGDRSVGLVFRPIAIGTVVCVVLLIVGRAVGAARRVRPSDAAEESFRRTARWLVLGAGYVISCSFALAAVRITGGPAWLPAVMVPTLALGLVVASTLALAHLGQGGSRRAAPSGGAPVGDRTPDAAWKWGMFYVNRGDPALFVEKRFGLGYTLNFGRAGAWWMIVALLALPVVVGVLLTR